MLHNFYKSYCLQGHAQVVNIALEEKISIACVGCECEVGTYM